MSLYRRLRGGQILSQVHGIILTRGITPLKNKSKQLSPIIEALDNYYNDFHDTLLKVFAKFHQHEISNSPLFAVFRKLRNFTHPLPSPVSRSRCIHPVPCCTRPYPEAEYKNFLKANSYFYKLYKFTTTYKDKLEQTLRWFTHS